MLYGGMGAFVYDIYLFNFLCFCVISVYFAQADALLKCYPPFVNYFEKTKETIHNCDKEKPRFHAFLKVFRIQLKLDSCI